MMKLDKKQNKLWAKRMHTSLKCYKENLITLFSLEKKILAFQSSNKTQSLNNIDTNIHLNEEEELVNLAENYLTSSDQKTDPIQDVTEPKKLLDEKTTDLLERLKSIFLFHF